VPRPTRGPEHCEHFAETALSQGSRGERFADIDDPLARVAARRILLPDIEYLVYYRVRLERFASKCSASGMRGEERVRGG
jgi:hypothetical protein